MTEEWVPKPASGIPARGSWPPFTDGNLVGVRHGALSPRLVGERAQALIDALHEEHPAWITNLDGRAVAAWARAEARCDLLHEWLDGRPVVQDDGKPHPAEELLVRHERRAADLRARLGLDPRARAELGRTTALGRVLADEGLARLRAAGRAAWDERGSEGAEQGESR